MYWYWSLGCQEDLLLLWPLHWPIQSQDIDAGGGVGRADLFMSVLISFRFANKFHNDLIKAVVMMLRVTRMLWRGSHHHHVCRAGQVGVAAPPGHHQGVRLWLPGHTARAWLQTREWFSDMSPGNIQCVTKFLNHTNWRQSPPWDRTKYQALILNYLFHSSSWQSV